MSPSREVINKSVYNNMIKRRNFFKLAAGAAYLGPSIAEPTEITPWIEQPATAELIRQEIQQAEAEVATRSAGDIRLRDVLRLYGQGRENLDWLFPLPLQCALIASHTAQAIRGWDCHYTAMERLILGDNAQHKLTNFLYINDIQFLFCPGESRERWISYGAIVHYEFEFEDRTRPNFVFADGPLHGSGADRRNAKVDWCCQNLTSDERAAVPRWDFIAATFPRVHTSPPFVTQHS